MFYIENVYNGFIVNIVIMGYYYTSVQESIN